MPIPFKMTLPVEFWQHLRGAWQSYHEWKILISYTGCKMTAIIFTEKELWQYHGIVMVMQCIKKNTYNLKVCKYRLL